MQNQPHSLTGKRVLVCSDEALTVILVSRALKQLEMDVVGTAANGEEAVTLAQQERPEFLLMDFSMPRLDGLKAAQGILAVYPACIILMTGRSLEELQEQAYAAGISGVIPKPFTAESLPGYLHDAFATFCERSRRTEESEPSPVRAALP